jgi:lipopolysaccharide transport system ATP-binding protein
VIRVRLNCKDEIINPIVWISFYDKEQRVFAEIRNFRRQVSLSSMQGEITFAAVIKALPFGQGVYSITLGVLGEIDGMKQTLFRYQSAVYFNVNAEEHGWAPVQLDPQWEVQK